MNRFKNICICGGGNLGTVISGVALSKGYAVNMLTGHPEKWNSEITVRDSKGTVYSGKLSKVSSDSSEVIPDSELVILCLPGYLISQTLESIKPFLNHDAVVGSIVSSTGFFFEAHKILPETISLFGFQRVPFISRIEEYGKSAALLGYKRDLFVALENCNNSHVREVLEDLFLAPVHILDSYYEATLTNSNPLLHTARLYAMWQDWDGAPFKSQSKFYYDWDNEASEMLIAMDNEFMELLKALGIREGAIPSILSYYESNNAEELTAKIKTIPAFQSILSPMLKIDDNSWIPDFDSRYFTEDFQFGLRFIKELAEEKVINAHHINQVYEWGMSITLKYKSH